MNDALGILVMIFMTLTVVGLLSLVLQFILKDEKKQRNCFYLLVATSLITATNGIMMNFMPRNLVILSLATLGIVALAISKVGRSQKAFLVAKLFASASLLGTIITSFV